METAPPSANLDNMNEMVPLEIVQSHSLENDSPSDTAITFHTSEVTPTGKPKATSAKFLDKKWNTPYGSFGPRTFMQPTMILKFIVLVIMIIVIAVVSVYHHRAVEFLQPMTEHLRAYHGGWLIPIFLLIAFTFTPLPAHDIIGVLCGLVWGMWKGFAIVAAGTFLGEMLLYYILRMFCADWFLKKQKNSINVTCLCQIVKEGSLGGFWIALAARFSLVSGHFVTGLLTAAGVSPLTIFSATLFGQPKQMVVVYAGVLLKSSVSKQSQHATALKYVIGTITLAVTIAVTAYFAIRLSEKRKEILAGSMTQSMQSPEPQMDNKPSSSSMSYSSALSSITSTAEYSYESAARGADESGPETRYQRRVIIGVTPHEMTNEGQK